MAQFLDLPPEIRQLVYTLLLVFPGTLKITKDENRLSRCKRGTKYSLTATADGAPVGSALSAAIVCTNKEVNAEAAPILYFRNRFNFASTYLLETFMDRLNDLAFSLSDVEEPRRILLPADRLYEGDPGAARCARETWTRIKGIVVRTGTGYIWAKTTRPYMYHGVAKGEVPSWIYEAGSKEVQLKRLMAFEFRVDRSIELKKSDEDDVKIISDPAERAKAFKDLVIACWRRDFEAVEAAKSFIEE